MSETKWSNFELLSFTDGRTRFIVGISSPSENEYSSRVMLSIQLSNESVRQSINLNYHDCLSLSAVFSKFKDLNFIKKLFELVQTKGTQEVVRPIKGKVLRMSFFLTREGDKSAKIAIYSNPNDILELVVPLSVVLSFCSIVESYINDYVKIVLQIHTIRRLDEVVTINREQKHELDVIKININNVANEKTVTESIQSEPEVTSTTSVPQDSSTLMADFQMFESKTNVKIDVPDHILQDESSKKNSE